MNTIELFADNLTKKDCLQAKRHVSCRCVCVQNNQILMLYSPGLDVYVLPGGGLEKNESLEDCALRELSEETGYVGHHPKFSIRVVEYFQDVIWETNFFVVEVTNQTKGSTSFTEEEQRTGLEIQWLDLYEALELLDTYSSKHPHGSNIHTRESLGILHSVI